MDFRWLKELWQGKKFLGPVVERVTAVPVTGTLYTVAGGRIIVTSIVGQVTIVMNAVATVVRLIATPTLGTARNMCEDVDIQGFAEGDLVGITGVPGDDLIPAAGTSSGSIPAQTLGVVVKPGTIRMNLGAGGTTGSIRWTLHYIPLDNTATVT